MAISQKQIISLIVVVVTLVVVGVFIALYIKNNPKPLAVNPCDKKCGLNAQANKECNCECKAAFTECNKHCYRKCPEGSTRNSSSCVCECDTDKHVIIDKTCEKKKVCTELSVDNYGKVTGSEWDPMSNVCKKCDDHTAEDHSLCLKTCQKTFRLFDKTNNSTIKTFKTESDCQKESKNNSNHECELFDSWANGNCVVQPHCEIHQVSKNDCEGNKFCQANLQNLEALKIHKESYQGKCRVPISTDTWKNACESIKGQWISSDSHCQLKSLEGIITSVEATEEQQLDINITVKNIWKTDTFHATKWTIKCNYNNKNNLVYKTQPTVDIGTDEISDNQISLKLSISLMQNTDFIYDSTVTTIDIETISVTTLNDEELNTSFEGLPKQINDIKELEGLGTISWSVVEAEKVSDELNKFQNFEIEYSSEIVKKIQNTQNNSYVKIVPALSSVTGNNKMVDKFLCFAWKKLSEQDAESLKQEYRNEYNTKPEIYYWAGYKKKTISTSDYIKIKIYNDTDDLFAIIKTEVDIDVNIKVYAFAAVKDDTSSIVRSQPIIQQVSVHIYTENECNQIPASMVNHKDISTFIPEKAWCFDGACIWSENDKKRADQYCQTMSKGKDDLLLFSWDESGGSCESITTQGYSINDPGECGTSGGSKKLTVNCSEVWHGTRTIDRREYDNRTNQLEKFPSYDELLKKNCPVVTKPQLAENYYRNTKESGNWSCDNQTGQQYVCTQERKCLDMSFGTVDSVHASEYYNLPLQEWSWYFYKFTKDYLNDCVRMHIQKGKTQFNPGSWVRAGTFYTYDGSQPNNVNYTKKAVCQADAYSKCTISRDKCETGEYTWNDHLDDIYILKSDEVSNPQYHTKYEVMVDENAWTYMIFKLKYHTNKGWVNENKNERNRNNSDIGTMYAKNGWVHEFYFWALSEHDKDNLFSSAHLKHLSGSANENSSGSANENSPLADLQSVWAFLYP